MTLSSMLPRLVLIASLAGVWSCSNRTAQPGAGNTAGTIGTATGVGGTGGAGTMTGPGGTGGAIETGTGGLGGATGGAGISGMPSGTASNHRAEEVICAGPGTDAAAMPTDAGARQDGGPAQSCTQDSDCVGCAGGWPGRCEGPFSNCVCDECGRDEDCGTSGVCACDGRTFGYSHTRRGNSCVPGNCRVDADCGPAGFCSPTVDISAGSFYGVAGYYCHTPNDQCTNDTDCSQGDCRYAPQVGHWVCASGGAAG